MQQYADCVNTVHPSAMDPSSVLAMKVAVAVVLLGMLIGSVRGFYNGDWLFGAFAGLFGTLGVSIVIGLVWWIVV